MESQHQEKNSITPLDEQKLQQFLEKILSDVGGAASWVDSLTIIALPYFYAISKQ
jgi:hypothetical protein